MSTRLKIGYVSPDFKTHPVGNFIEPILEHHDRSSIEVYCYGEVQQPDDLTKRIQSLADHWFSTVGLSDQEVIQQIKQDQIDILVDLAGHTENNRLPIFFAKSAPIQVNYLGYFATTGIPTIDYWITDHCLHPLDTNEKTVEKIWRLPRSYIAYKPHSEAPDIAPLPALSSSNITFGSFNNFSKLNAPLLSLWAKILNALPNACLLVKTNNHNLEDPQERTSIEDLFQKQGIDPKRITLISSEPLSDDYLALYNKIDIHLDTFPYNGCTTTCDALSMGVPVLTLAGSRKIERMGYSLLQAVGLEDWISHSPEEYIQKAIAFAQDREKLAELRSTLRQRLLQSELGNVRGLTKALEEAYGQMYANNLGKKDISPVKLENPVKCKICEANSSYFATTKILQKYDVDYFQCSHCGFVQTEHPYWLDEAYSQAIATSDVGLVYRNINLQSFTGYLLFNYFNHEAKFLDYGAGYGLLVRLMRDQGFDFYWDDKFCHNLFAQGFELKEGDNNDFELVTAFEVFEHFANPLREIEKILKFSSNILFGTSLLPDNNPKPNEWDYYVPHEGQHISIYTLASLKILAKRYGLKLYSNGNSLHLLTNKKFPDNLFDLLNTQGKKPNKVSLLEKDYRKTVNEKTKSSLSQGNAHLKTLPPQRQKRIIVVDGVFFQFSKTGISRVWRSLLQEWANTDFAQHILVLDRANTTPRISGISYRTIHPYNYNNLDGDRKILQQICDEEGADLFISTYYTTPVNTPSVFMAYDMIPEVLDYYDLNNPMWREKHNGIKHASSYISISENTARDLVRIFPDIALESITVAHCGVASYFSPASEAEINEFKTKYGITKPYFLLVGGLEGYKNPILFFQAFAQLPNKSSFDIVATGDVSNRLDQWRNYTQGCTLHALQLSDQKLRLAYAGALALVYPSKYEGFGMPVAEAMACGCPVITTPNGSLTEVGGNSVLYVNDNDVKGMLEALYEVQKPEVTQSLIKLGLEQAKKFSWSKMAKIISSTLIQTAEKLELENPLTFYRHYLQKLCPHLEKYDQLLKAVQPTSWTNPSTLIEWNNVAVIILIEAEETSNLATRKDLLNNALIILEKGQSYPLCAAHLALIYALIGDYSRAWELANTTIEMLQSVSQTSHAKGLIYLPPTSRSLFFKQGGLVTLLSAEDGRQQALLLCIEALCQSQLFFYNTPGRESLQLATQVAPQTVITNLQLGIAHLHVERAEGLFYLQRAIELAPDNVSSIQALYLAYRNLSQLEIAQIWHQTRASDFNPQSLEWMWAQLPYSSPFTYVPFDNLLFAVEANFKSIVTAVLLAQGDWFEAEMELWRTYLKPGMIVIDIGANVGVYTFSAAQKVGLQGKVIAIEPFQDCITCLEETVRINQLPWVKIYAGAASNYDGSARLSLHSSSELNEVISNNLYEPSSNQTFPINCFTLDSLLEKENLTQVDWLKIDAEGHEMQVLLGAETLLTRFTPHILYENIAGVQSSNFAVSEYLCSRGYQLYYYRPYLQELVPVQKIEEIAGHLNLIAIYPKQKQD